MSILHGILQILLRSVMFLVFLNCLIRCCFLVYSEDEKTL